MGFPYQLSMFKAISNLTEWPAINVVFLKVLDIGFIENDAFKSPFYGYWIIGQ